MNRQSWPTVTIDDGTQTRRQFRKSPESTAIGIRGLERDVSLGLAVEIEQPWHRARGIEVGE